MDATRCAWDRKPREPAVAYTRFLFFRNLGPGRTIDAAFRALQQTLPEAERTGAQRASGQWYDDSAAWGWVARASAWDVQNLAESSAAVVCDYVAVLQGAARKALERLSDPDFTIPDWEKFLETVRALGEFIPREAIREVQRPGNAGERRRAG